jgi:hypothetical protein
MLVYMCRIIYTAGKQGFLAKMTKNSMNITYAFHLSHHFVGFVLLIFFGVALCIQQDLSAGIVFWNVWRHQDMGVKNQDHGNLTVGQPRMYDVSFLGRYTCNGRNM